MNGRSSGDSKRYIGNRNISERLDTQSRQPCKGQTEVITQRIDLRVRKERNKLGNGGTGKRGQVGGRRTKNIKDENVIAALEELAG